MQAGHKSVCSALRLLSAPRPLQPTSRADGSARQAADVAQRDAGEAIIAASDSDTSIVVYVYRPDGLPKHVLEVRPPRPDLAAAPRVSPTRRPSSPCGSGPC